MSLLQLKDHQCCRGVPATNNWVVYETVFGNGLFDGDAVAINVVVVARIVVGDDVGDVYAMRQTGLIINKYILIN